MPATEDSAKPAPSVETDWAAADAQVRSVAGWIVKSFAAVATALVGTSPLLVHLGNLHRDGRSAVAILGAAVALVAIGLIISWASDVNLTELTAIDDLQNPVGEVEKLLDKLASTDAGRELYLAGQPSITALLAQRRTTVLTYSGALNALPRLTSDAAKAETRFDIANAQTALVNYDAAIRNLQGWASYRKIRNRFDRARPRMFGAAAIALVGMALWLGGLSIDLSSGSTSPAGASSTLGTLAWTTTGDRTASDDLRRQLGLQDDTCTRTTVVLAGGTGDPGNPWQVTLVPNQGCTATPGTFTVDRRLATFAVFVPAASPKASVTIKTDNHTAAWIGGIVVVFVFGLVIGPKLRRMIPL